jgi:hypothetical protein
MKGIFCILIVVIANVTFAQSYPKKVVIDNDTCIVFTLEQSRKLITWDVELERCKSESIVLIEESSVKDSLIAINKEIAQKYSDIVVICDSIKLEKNELIKIHLEEKQLLEKQIKRCKRQRFLSITLGVLTTSILTTLILIK